MFLWLLGGHNNNVGIIDLSRHSIRKGSFDLMQLAFTFVVITILVSTIFLYGYVSSRRILKDILATNMEAFYSAIGGKEHYLLYIPDERAIWVKGSKEQFFTALKGFTVPSLGGRTRIEFSYKVDDENECIYLWETYMFISKGTNRFDDFRSVDQMQKDAARINAAIEAHRGALTI